MSLMLRKNCQETLNNNNLANYHTSIDDDSKALQIVGECGKPLITIHGIVFNRRTLTANEVEYAVELLEDFLATHKVELQHYIKKANAFKAKPEIFMDSDDGLIEISEKVVYRGDNYFYITYEDNGLKFTNVEGSLRLTSHDYENMSPQRLTSFKADKTLEKRAFKYLKDFISWSKEKEAIEELERALSTCDI